MSNPIHETLFFLSVARHTLCDMVTESDTVHKDKMKSFLMDQASDLQVLSLLVLGELPEETHNPVIESVLWEMLKDTMLLNSDVFLEHISQNDFDMIQEMNPVSTLGYSSARPVLELHMKTGYIKNSNSEEFKALNEGIMDYVKDYIRRKRKEHDSVFYNKLKKKLKQAKETGKKNWKYIKRDLRWNPEAKKVFKIGSALVATAIGYAAFKFLRDRLSKARKACKHYDGKNKAECLAKWKVAAYERQIRELQSAKSACKQSKDPAKCNALVDKKITKAQAQLAKAKNKQAEVSTPV